MPGPRDPHGWSRNPDAWGATGYFQKVCHEQAEKWIRKRDVLADAIKRIREIDEEKG